MSDSPDTSAPADTVGVEVGYHVDGIATCVRAGANHNKFAVACSSLTGAVWNGQLRIFDADLAQSDSCEMFELAGGCAAVDWAGADGDLVVCGGDDGHVTAYHVQDGGIVHAWGVHDAGVLAVCAGGPEHTQVLSCGADGVVKQWEVGQSSCLESRRAHASEATGVAWSTHDANQYVSVGRDAGVAVADVRSPAAAVLHARLAQPLTSVAESGHTLATGNEGGEVHVFDRRKGLSEPLHIHTQHLAAVHTLAFHPSKAWLASGGDDGAYAVTDTSLQRSLKLKVAHTDFVRAVAWRDGEELLTGGWDKRVLVHKM